MNKKSDARRLPIIHMPMSMIVRHMGSKGEKVVKNAWEFCKWGTNSNSYVCVGAALLWHVEVRW